VTLGARDALALAAAAEPCRTVHGRMELWNGAPSVRIWVVGPKRVLGVVHKQASFKDLPLAVRQIWTGAEADKAGRGRSMATSRSVHSPASERDTCGLSG
jgi:hypothetical protein